MVIPDYVVNQLNELPIEDVAEKLGISIRSHKALCFMHDDHTPSLTFAPQKNLFFCFVCSKGGGPIQLVCEYEGWKFQEACIWLAAQYGIWRPNEDIRLVKSSKNTNRRFIPSKKTENTGIILDEEIGNWIVNHAVLSDLAKHFLFEERKYEQEVIKSLKIGSLTYPQLLIDNLIKEFGKERCEQSGYFKKWNGALSLYYKAPCLLFPYFDINGKLHSIQSRYLGEISDKKNRFVFPKGVKQRLFNAQILKGISPEEPLYVSEGVTDCLALLSAGKKAVAFPSSSICHSEDVRLLASKYIFMYPDKDAAGDGLLKRLNEGLKPYGNTVHKQELPEGINDYSEYYLTLQ